MNVFILPRMNVFGTRINTDGHGFTMRINNLFSHRWHRWTQIYHADEYVLAHGWTRMDTDFNMRRK